MPLFWSVSLTILVAVVLNLKTAAMMASVGNWGEAVGSMFFGPIVFFLIVQVVLFHATRLVRGSQAVAKFTTSRLNYISGLITLLGVLGAAVNPA